MSDTNYTSRFKADISDLKKNITTANKLLKQINSEYNVASAKAEAAGNAQDLLAAKLDKANKTLQQQNTKLKSYKDQIKTTEDYVKKLKETEDDLTQKLEDAKKLFGNNSNEVKDYKEQLSKVQKEIKENEDAIDKLTVSMNNQEAQCIKTEAEVKDYSEQLNDLQNNANQTAQSQNDVANATGDMSTGFLNAEAAVGALSETFEGLYNVVDNVTNKIEDLVKTTLVGLKDAIVNISKSVMNTGMDYEASLDMVGALMGADEEAMTALDKKAKEVGASTNKTATEIANSFQYMALAGWTAEEAIAGIDTATALAIASGEDMASTCDIITDDLSAWGLTAQDSTMFTNKLAVAMSSSNTNVAQLGESYKYCAATADSLGYSLDDTTAALMVMADAGIKGSQSGTGLASIMTRLGNNVSNCRDLLEEYGVEVYDDKGKVKELCEILDGMKSIYGGLTDEQKSNLSFIVAGKTAQSQLNTVLKESTGSFEEYKEKLVACTNESTQVLDMSARVQDNTKGSLEILKSAVEANFLSIYSKVTEPIKGVFDTLSTYLSQLSVSIESGNLSTYFIMLGEALAEVGNALTQILVDNGPAFEEFIASLVTLLVELIKQLPTIVSTLLPKLLDLFTRLLEKAPDLISSILPTLLDAIGWFIDNFETITTALYVIQGVIGLIIGALKTFIGILGALKIAELLGLISSVGGALASVGGWFASIGSAIAGFGSTIVGVLSGPIGWIILIISSIIGLLVLLYNKCKPFKKFVDNLWTTIKDFFANLWEGIKNFDLSVFIENIKTKLAELKDNFVNKFAEIGESISTKLSEIWDNIVEFFVNLPEAIGYWLGYLVGLTISTAIKIKDAINQFFLDAGQAIVTFFTELPQKAMTFFSDLLQKYLEFQIKVINFVWDLIDKIVTFIKELPGKIWNIFLDLMKKFLEIQIQIVEFFTRLIDKVVSFFTETDWMEIGKNILLGLLDGIKSQFTNFTNTIDGFIGGIKKGFTDAFDIHSPSRWMKNFIGKNLMEGLSLGISTNEDSVTDTINGLNTTIKDGFDFSNVFGASAALAGGYSNYNSNTTTNNDNTVNYSPIFNYNKPLNSREIYRQNKNMLNSILNK